MRIGLLGAGYMGRLHASALAALPGVELVAAAGATARSANAQALARDLGIGRPVTLEEVLGDGQIQAVVVTTPPLTHKHVVAAALAAGSAPHLRTALGAHPVEAEDAHIVGVFRREKDPCFLGAPEAAASLRLAERVREATGHPQQPVEEAA